MKEIHIKRERDKVQELAREYREKGYRVLIEPKKVDLPHFLKNMNYRPDLIALSETGNLIFEVKSSTTVQKVKEFARVADLIREHEGWDFVFVMTNPKEKQEREIGAQIPSIKDACQYISKAKRLLEVDRNDEFSDAAFLLAWSAMEAAIRYALAEIYGQKDQKKVISLIRDSVMYGIVSREDGKYLDSLLSIRNRIAHGYSSQEVMKKEVNELIELVNRTIAELKNQEHLTTLPVDVVNSAAEANR